MDGPHLQSSYGALRADSGALARTSVFLREYFPIARDAMINSARDFRVAEDAFLSQLETSATIGQIRACASSWEAISDSTRDCAKARKVFGGLIVRTLDTISNAINALEGGRSPHEQASERFTPWQRRELRKVVDEFALQSAAEISRESELLELNLPPNYSKALLHTIAVQRNAAGRLFREILHSARTNTFKTDAVWMINELTDILCNFVNPQLSGEAVPRLHALAERSALAPILDSAHYDESWGTRFFHHASHVCSSMSANNLMFISIGLNSAELVSIAVLHWEKENTDSVEHRVKEEQRRIVKAEEDAVTYSIAQYSEREVSTTRAPADTFPQCISYTAHCGQHVAVVTICQPDAEHVREIDEETTIVAKTMARAFADHFA